MDKVFVIGRDAVPQYVRLEAGESLRWTFVVLPFAAVADGDSCGSSPRKTSASLHPSQAGAWAPPVHMATGGHGFSEGTAAGNVSDIHLEIDLCGPGAEVDIAGLYLCTGVQQCNIDLLVKHVSGGCTSRQLFKGIAGGESKTSFDGLVYVAQDAQKTKAYQENHNILLTRTALVESRPQLEIYADDVECSHGATTGFLDADELFYMRSRGIPKAEARRLQMISFLSPVLNRLPEGLADEVVSKMEML